MAMVRWDPLRDGVSLRDRINRMFEESLYPPEERGEVRGGTWSPSVDICEKDRKIILTAELPGVDENDIEVEIDGKTLTLKGHKEFEKETKEEDYYRIERAYGGFNRSFTLPSHVDAGKIKAEYGDGVLRITMPKKPEMKAKKVNILKSAKSKKKEPPISRRES